RAQRALLRRRGQGQRPAVAGRLATSLPSPASGFGGRHVRSIRRATMDAIGGGAPLGRLNRRNALARVRLCTVTGRLSRLTAFARWLDSKMANAAEHRRGSMILSLQNR